MTEHVLETARLRLEPIRSDHAGALWIAIDRSLPELLPRFPWAPKTSPAEIAEFAQRCEVGWTEGTGWEWVILHDGAVAGVIGFHAYDPMRRSAAIGYWVRSDLAGRGFVSEAASAVVGFAFDHLGLNRIELEAATDNLASQRIAQKLGFQKEGTKRAGDLIDGKQIDTYLYGLLASDPRPGI